MSDAAEVARVTRALRNLAERVVIKITLDTHANLIESTPVDTGWAQANWITSVGAPVVADVSPTGIPDQRYLIGTAQVLAYKLGPPTYIVNNVPYIGRLNNGSSLKEPAGFVQRSIQKGLTEGLLALSTSPV